MTDSRTIHLINPPEEARTSLDDFLKDTGAPVEFTDSPENADLTIDWPDDKLVCDLDHFHAGGRISCPDAFRTAGRLRMNLANTGNLMNLLKIKIFGCQLGCFK